MSLGGFRLLFERAKHLDFSVPVTFDEYRFLIRYPEEESRFKGPIRPYQISVNMKLYAKRQITLHNDFVRLNHRSGSPSL